VIGDLESAMTLCWAAPYLPGDSVSEEILYVATWDQLSKTQSNHPKFAVCVGDKEASHIFFLENEISGFICRDNADLCFILCQIQEVFRKYESLERELLMAMLKDVSTRSVLNCCAKFFEGHIMLFSSHNMGFLLLDYSDIFMPPESNTLWQEILEQNRFGFDRNPRDSVKMLPKHPEKYPKATFHEKTEGYLSRFVTAFDYGDLRFATLIILETEKELTSRQHWLVDYVADVIHPMITRRYNSSVNVRNHARKTLHTALHQSRQSGISTFNTMKNSLDQLRWKTDDDYRIILVSLPPECHSVSHYLYNYERVFADSYFDCIALYFEDLIFILLHNNACEITKNQVETLDKQLSLDNGVCSIGNIFCEFSQITAQFELTVLPLQLHTGGKRVHLYSEMMLSHIVNELDSFFPLRKICHNAVVRLHAYDLANGTEYMPTLEAYLMHNNSLQKAANILYIHKNTMTYRLKCIERIVKMDLNNPDERLGVLLSCIVLRILS